MGLLSVGDGTNNYDHNQIPSHCCRIAAKTGEIVPLYLSSVANSTGALEAGQGSKMAGDSDGRLFAVLSTALTYLPVCGVEFVAVWDSPRSWHGAS